MSSFTANRGLQPTLVGIMQNRQTQQTSGQTASPLLGVQIVPVDTLRNPDPFRANTANTNRVNPGSANPGLVAPTQGQPAPLSTDGTGPQARPTTT